MATNAEILTGFENFSRSARDTNALLQHISDQLHEEKTRYNWVGFYFLEEPARDTLVLGPHAGSFKPLVRIPINKGLCGACASSCRTVAVNNVGNDSRYIGGDMVKSNLVAPVLVKGKFVAEICIESYFADTFDPMEQKFLESCAEIAAQYIAKH